ncbi:hypothetical protein TSUD_367510 [Trifolium subterraneum]|uniref:Uncharacterized protein n=1 Tax=Trifolium subterraneum TaxID=3900 RepID=A0A2Z6N6N5_TRISU|nr:hypothetical protein TSUD_367510 [Trifolium subterraneum]
MKSMIVTMRNQTLPPLLDRKNLYPKSLNHLKSDKEKFKSSSEEEAAGKEDDSAKEKVNKGKGKVAEKSNLVKPLVPYSNRVDFNTHWVKKIVPVIDSGADLGIKRKRGEFENDEDLSVDEMAGPPRDKNKELATSAKDKGKNVKPVQSHSIPFVDLETSLHFDSDFTMNLNPLRTKPSTALSGSSTSHGRPINRPLFSLL